jgi:hypothetical protein
MRKSVTAAIMPTNKKRAAIPAAIILSALIPFFVLGQNVGPKVDPRTYLAELARLSARKPFLTDSPDVYLEPQSLNRFFTLPIYRKLQGNAYFGYRYDEGFVFDGKEVQLEVVKELMPEKRCSASYRIALEKALESAGLKITPKASCQIGICIVGIEERETPQTIPGIMIEAYLRNAQLKKSLFIRYGAGSPRGLPAALRLSAEILVSEMAARQKTHVGE